MNDSSFMLELAAKLGRIKALGLATQSMLAIACDIDQETVSKVISGRRRRRTASLERLDVYANMLLDNKSSSHEIDNAVSEFLVFGTEHELVSSIRMCTNLVTNRARAHTQAARPPIRSE